MYKVRTTIIMFWMSLELYTKYQKDIIYHT